MKPEVEAFIAHYGVKGCVGVFATSEAKVFAS